MKKVEYETNPKRCVTCKKVLPYSKRRNKYCDHSCSAKTVNLGVRRHGNYDYSPHKCLTCDKMVVGIHKYCSHQCHQVHQQKVYIERWLKELETGVTGKKMEISSHIRHYMYDKVGYKCEKCGWHAINPTTGKVPLQVHHKNGDYKDNRPENLEVLCPNCHSLTPTFGSLNKNGRRKNGHL